MPSSTSLPVFSLTTFVAATKAQYTLSASVGTSIGLMNLDMSGGSQSKEFIPTYADATTKAATTVIAVHLMILSVFFMVASLFVVLLT